MNFCPEISMGRCHIVMTIACNAFLAGCATPSTPPCAALPLPERPPVVVQMACPPELPTMADDSMGSAVQALMDAAETYHMCRRAALAGAQ